jgi:hypothetical protein
MKRLDKEGQARYFGKKAGDEIVVPGFPKVVIRQVFTLDMAKVAEFAAAKKAAAVAAQSNPVSPKE